MGTKSAIELTPHAMTVLEERYLLRNEHGGVVETPDQLFFRVANAVADAESRQKRKWAERFFELMASCRFIPNSPTLMNAGKRGGQLSACYVLPVLDSLDGIFDSLKFAAKIHQSGGGTGFSFSQIRPRGSVVQSTHGVASGPVSFIHIFDVATDTIKQGGTRRGANMAVLNAEHPDVFEFIESKLDLTSITNFNISVGATDRFMLAVLEDGDFWLRDPRTGADVKKVRAKELFNRIVEAAWRCGDPGLIFLDRVNLFNPTPLEGRMESTNPCVVGDTRICIEGGGMVPIQELVGKQPCIGTEISGSGGFRTASQVICTGIKPVFRLITSEGYELVLTEDHRIMTDRGDMQAKDLQPGDRIRLMEIRSLGGRGIDTEGEESRLGEVIGWLAGDGHFTHHGDGKRVAVLSFYGRDKVDAAPRFLETVQRLIGKEKLSLNEVTSRDMVYIRSQRLCKLLAELGVDSQCKKNLPEVVWRGSIDLQLGFLRALFSADGSVQGSAQKGLSVRLSSSQLELLKDVQLLLLSLGVKSILYKNRRVEHVKLLPNASKQLQEYSCVAQHELIVSKSSLVAFSSKIGFLIRDKQIRLDSILASYARGSHDDIFFATFEELVLQGEEEVFDLTEPASSHFYANGLLVHNCGEQPLLPFESCNLGSLNLGFYLKNGIFNWEGFRRDIEVAIRFLDNVVDVNCYPLEQCEKITLKNRKIGLGVMGFADLLLLLGIPYTAPEAVLLGEQIMSFLDREAKRSSAILATTRGAFPNWKGSMWHSLGYPSLRNATVSTVAPTGTISIIAGASSGIEPIFSAVFVRNVLDGKRLLEVQPSVRRFIEKRKLKLDCLTQEDINREMGPAWVPSHQVPVDVHIRIQAAFQRHSDSAVSKTVNLPESATVADVAEAYLLAYRKGCKGITVYRDKSRKSQVLENVGTSSSQSSADDEVCLIC